MSLMVFGVSALLLVGLGISQADKIAKHPQYPLNWYGCVGGDAALDGRVLVFAVDDVSRRRLICDNADKTPFHFR